MKIATAPAEPTITPKSATIDSTQTVRFTDWARADRTKRQIIEAVEAHECPKELADYIDAESLMIDALYLFDPAMAEDIEVAANDHKVILQAGLASVAASGSAPAIPAIAQATKPVNKGKTMFNIDTGASTGAQGPYMSYYSNGSAAKGFKPQTWALRSKDDAGNWGETQIEAFGSDSGCVMDLDTLKLGWEKDTANGPERRWNPTISQATPRPDESTDDSGRKAWKNCLSIRCAIGHGQAATWEQGAFGAYLAFDRLAKQIVAQYPGDGTLPRVRMTGATVEYKSNVPTLEIIDWVQRPDCLKADAPAIATAPAPQPAAAPAPAQPPANAPVDKSAVSAAGGF